VIIRTPHASAKWQPGAASIGPARSSPIPLSVQQITSFFAPPDSVFSVYNEIVCASVDWANKLSSCSPSHPSHQHDNAPTQPFSNPTRVPNSRIFHFCLTRLKHLVARVVPSTITHTSASVFFGSAIGFISLCPPKPLFTRAQILPTSFSSREKGVLLGFMRENLSSPQTKKCVLC